MSAIFRLKFAFIENDNKGGVEKVKKEYFAECETYTEAESLAYKVIEHYKMDDLGSVEYEIIKTKYTSAQIINNDVLASDNVMLNGLCEEFFQGECDGVFIIKVRYTEVCERTGKEKRTAATFLVCDKSTKSAATHLLSYLRDCLYDPIITDTKLDLCDSLFLSPETHKKIMNDEA